MKQLVIFKKMLHNLFYLHVKSHTNFQYIEVLMQTFLLVLNTGPPIAAVPPPAGYPGGLPMGYYSPQQPSAFPLYHPIGSVHSIQYQPGKYPMQNQPAPIMWMPGPTPMPNVPPGLEYLAQVLHTIPNYFLMKCEHGTWTSKDRSWVE
jgi:hypothetical protein